jgi:hypothetical protein
MVHCLIVPWTDAHETFHDTNPSQITPEAWMICHHPVFHGDDDSVAVKMPKPWHKWNYRPSRVSISSHITTIPAILPTFQQYYPRQKEKIRRTNRCMPCHSMPFFTVSPANWSACSSPLTPLCDGIHIMWISYSLFFSHQQASLISYTNEWVLRVTFRVCRAFKELMLSVTIRYQDGEPLFESRPQKSLK